MPIELLDRPSSRCRTKRRRTRTLCPLILLLGVACTSAPKTPEIQSTPPRPPRPTAQEPEPDPGHAWLIFGTDTVDAEVARSAVDRRTGLMNRTTVPEGTGMLFVFPTEDYRSFWMRDTFVALDIAFMGRDFTIIGIHALEPESSEFTRSSAPAKYALEVAQGWFAKKGILAGDTPRAVFGPTPGPGSSR